MPADSVRTRLGVVVTTLGLLATAGAPAGAVAPPQVDPEVAPPTASAGPVQPMAQRSECTGAGVLPGSDPGAVTTAQASLDLGEAWRHSRGDGQLVAVIDTGVTPGPRLPDLTGGGDFVGDSDGLTDCDGHGTLVAGLIAGQPGADGFSGVAPGARIVSIRQTSAHYAPRTPGEDPALARAALEVDTLARAVVRAADEGARVITISVATCLPADSGVDQRALGAALRYAAVDRDAVIVAAAGDTSRGLGGGSACASNPLGDAARPADPSLDLVRRAIAILHRHVDEMAEAYEKGLRAGDVITEAGQQKVRSVSDLEDRVDEAREAGRKSLLLLIRRSGEPRFVALTLE